MEANAADERPSANEHVEPSIGRYSTLVYEIFRKESDYGTTPPYVTYVSELATIQNQETRPPQWVPSASTTGTSTLIAYSICQGGNKARGNIRCHQGWIQD
jgi:hypothetical protein